MPILEIDGVGDVEVDDAFNKLSAPEQDAFVKNIVNQVKGGQTEGRFQARPQELGAFDLGYLGGQLKRGYGAAISGIAKTAREAGVSDEYTKPFIASGDALLRNAPRSASERFSRPAEGDTTLFGRSLNAIPGAIVEGGVGLAMDLAAIPVGAAVGGPVGALAAPVATYGAREYGRQLEERRDNNGGAPSSGAAQLGVGASVLAQGALNRVGLMGLAPGANLAQRGLVEAGKRIGVATGAEGATSGAQDLLAQAGTVLGTEKGRFDGDRAIDSALLGSATGLAVRGAAEASDVPKAGMAALARRKFDYKESIPDVAAEIYQIHQQAGRKLGNREDDARSLGEYSAVLDQERSVLNKEAERALKASFDANEIDLKQYANASEALTADRPTKSNIKALEKALGDFQEFRGAIDLAKRASVVSQLKEVSNYTPNKSRLFGADRPYVSGGLSKVSERFIDKAKAVAGGAALGGGVTYAGLKGLGTIGATTTALSNAAPVIGGLVGAYQGAKLIDKALGTYSPVEQMVRNNIPRNLQASSPGGDLPSMRGMRIQEAANDERVGPLMAEGRANMRAEESMAKAAQKLVEAQRKLDQAQGVQREAGYYEGLSGFRDDPDTVNGYVKKLGEDLRAFNAQKKLDERTQSQQAVEERRAQQQSEREAAMAQRQAEREAFEAQRQAERTAREEARQAERTAREQERAMRQSQKETEADARLREQETIAQGRENVRAEESMAKAASSLADAVRKLDRLKGEEKPSSHYADLKTLRVDPAQAATMMDNVKGQIADLQLAARQAKAAKTGAEKAPAKPLPQEKPRVRVPMGREVTGEAAAPKKEAPKNDTKPNEVVEGEVRKKAINAKAETFYRFERALRKRNGVDESTANTIIDKLQDINGSISNYNDGIKAVRKAAKEHPEVGDWMVNYLANPDKPKKDTPLGKIFYSKKLGGVIETKEQADKLRGRKD